MQEWWNGGAKRGVTITITITINKNKTLSVIVSPEFLQRIDRLVYKHNGRSRSDTMRRLLETGMAVEEGRVNLKHK